MSEVYGIWEVDVIEKDGRIVQHWEKKNVINYGFIGGLFNHMFDVGTDNLTLSPSTNPSKEVVVEKAQFGSLYLTLKDVIISAKYLNLKCRKRFRRRGWKT